MACALGNCKEAATLRRRAIEIADDWRLGLIAGRELETPLRALCARAIILGIVPVPALRGETARTEARSQASIPGRAGEVHPCWPYPNEPRGRGRRRQSLSSAR